jgi:hypothetical protein
MSMKTKQCKCASCAGAACKCGCQDARTTGQIKGCNCGDQCKLLPHLQLQGRLRCRYRRRAFRSQAPAFNRMRAMRGVPSDERSHEDAIC